MENCIEAGMDGYLAKPVRLKELQAVLKHFDLIAAVGKSIQYSGSSYSLCNLDTE